MWNTFQALCAEKGIEVIPSNTTRTEAEQVAYYAQGRKGLKAVNQLRAYAGLGPISLKDNARTVTWTLQSLHQYGVAVDFVIVKAGTAVFEIKADLNENDIPDYEECGKIAESVGFDWGGKFKRRDCVHLEYTGGLSLADLQKGLRPHEYAAASGSRARA
jgi:peptidoglycan L-alanyl-D-glutamate endopeptidase CwlK